MTRIEQGQAALAPAEMDLGALVRDVVQHFEFDLARAGCCLSVECPGPVVGCVGREPAGAGGDEPARERHQVRGGPAHRGDGSRRRPGRRSCRCSDHGIGIAADRLPKIFDRFERAVSSTHYGGLGLGLYLARSIVESHGGAITVESRVGEGSTFTVRLPRTQESRAVAGRFERE